MDKKAAAILARALANEGMDGCCLPVIGKCHCWRCDARRYLGDEPRLPLVKDRNGFARLPMGRICPTHGRYPEGRGFCCPSLERETYPVSALLA